MENEWDAHLTMTSCGKTLAAFLQYEALPSVTGDELFACTEDKECFIEGAPQLSGADGVADCLYVIGSIVVERMSSTSTCRLRCLSLARRHPQRQSCLARSSSSSLLTSRRYGHDCLWAAVEDPPGPRLSSQWQKETTAVFHRAFLLPRSTDVSGSFPIFLGGFRKPDRHTPELEKHRYVQYTFMCMRTCMYMFSSC